MNELYDSLNVASQFSSCLNESVAINTLPWHRKELVELSDSEVGVACGDGQLLALRTFKVQEEKPAVTVMEQSTDVYVLQNDQLRIVVENGVITSIYDIDNDREVIEKGGEANKFVIFDDIPLYWQAWDVEVYHLDARRKVEYGKTKIFEQKAHRVTLVTEIKISENSSIKSYTTLSAALKGQPSQIDVRADVNWHEDSKFLKVEFPVNVVNTEASYETAFSITKRPTHYNTSWDMAKFEVCCHKFADLSENNYGVSILNDCKYGFATAGKMMRLSLLRSPKAPDANADMGRHTIRWAILPHKGSLSSATVKAAYAFNNPLKPVTASKAALESVSSAPIKLVNTDESQSLVLDTIKRGQDDEDVTRNEGLRVNKGQSIILRVYESLGGRSRGTIETSFNVKHVTKTNILEDDLEKIEMEDGKIPITLRPFEVATFKLQL